MRKLLILATVVISTLAMAYPLTVLEITTEQKYKVALLKELVPICACESAGSKTAEPTQYDKKGNVLIGITKDIGQCQINPVHIPKAESMGLDLTKEQDNIIYANYLYKTEGSKPWNASRNCWQ